MNDNATTPTPEALQASEAELAPTDDSIDLAKGLPMFTKADPEALARERQELGEIAARGFFGRCRGYWSKTGPGFLQSAMTLGGGSAGASLFLGAYLQYEFLWVQPLAMLLGIIVLSAMAHQTLSSQMRPFDALRRYAHPSVAWAWAIATLLATIIWHLPQYALAAGMAEFIIGKEPQAIVGKVLSTGQVQAIMAKVNSLNWAWLQWDEAATYRNILLLSIGVVVLIISTAITWSYGSGRRGVRIYERALKFLVWMIVAAFAVVVIAQTAKGKVEWGKVARGFIPRRIPTGGRDFSILMAALAAAVGINMTFLYPYTLLARGWGKEHRGLAKFDLITGMFIPYTLATSLMIIAAGSTIYNPAGFGQGKAFLFAPKAAAMFVHAGMPEALARYVFGLGILGMALSTITLHMLVSGFAFCEIFRIEPGGWAYRLACLLPAPAFIGVIWWGKMAFWVVVPTSAVCGLLLPIAYIGFFILNHSRAYLGNDQPHGAKAALLHFGQVVAILVIVSSGVYYVIVKWPDMLDIWHKLMASA